MKQDFKKKNPVEHKIRQMAENLRSRLNSRRDDPSNKSYKDKGIESKIGNGSREIYKYIYDHFYEDIKRMLDNGQTPSIDRIDSNKHYEDGNLRIITFEENSRLGREKSKEVCSKPVEIAYEDGRTFVYASAVEAAEKSGISRNIISKILINKTKQKKEYKVKYI